MVVVWSWTVRLDTRQQQMQSYQTPSRSTLQCTGQYCNHQPNRLFAKQQQADVLCAICMLVDKAVVNHYANCRPAGRTNSHSSRISTYLPIYTNTDAQAEFGAGDAQSFIRVAPSPPSASASRLPSGWLTGAVQKDYESTPSLLAIQPNPLLSTIALFCLCCRFLPTV